MKPIIFDAFLQNLSAGALNDSFTIPEDCNLSQVLIKAAAAVTQTGEIIHVDLDTSVEHVLDAINLSGQQDHVFRPTGKCPFKKGDILKVTLTNATTPAIIVNGKSQFEAVT